MKQAILGLCFCVAFFACGSVFAVTNLLVNPGFLNAGDGWFSLGATGFNDFFGGNPHASLFGDDAFNEGEVLQLGIPGVGGTTYQFDFMNTRIEANWDANLRFGLEYYAADDATKLGETFATIDTATRLGLPNVDGGGAANGAVFSMRGTAVPGTSFVRPVMQFDMVNPTYVAGVTQQANAFVFDTYLSEAPGIGDEFLKNPGFEDENGNGNLGDSWSSFGAAGFNDFFAGNGHASLFSDQVGNFGGVYQQSILGTEGTAYEFSLTNVRIEENVSADFRFGLEYYGDDDFNKLGETIVALDTSITGDGLSFSMLGTAVAGTRYVRPVVSFDNVTSTATSQENVFIFDASMTELDFVVDPDFNDDGMVNGVDVDELVAEIVQMTNSPLYDLTNDGFVNTGDLTTWLSEAGALNLASGNPYLVGDANLDGTVDGQDFIDWNSNKFTSVAAWTRGDFNADGTIDGQDFIEWNTYKFMSADAVSGVVPEPASTAIFLGGVLGILVSRRRAEFGTADH